jgi:isopenicillin N synthase-like dioxygenase
MSVFSEKEQEMGIPVLDLKDPTILTKLRQACESYGFFYLTNHEVDLTAAVFEQSEHFFQMDLENKRDCLQNSSHCGYTVYGDETVNPLEQAEGDTKEGYYIGTDDSKNIWPSKDLLPQWKETMLAYHRQCSSLGSQLAQLIFQCYGISEEIFHSCFDRPTAILRLLRYGKILSDPSQGRYGTGPHTDYGLLTILATRPHEPGLEIFYNSSWIPVMPQDPSWLVINLGDSLQRLSNDLLRSTLHRVLISDTQRYRHSIPFFYEPNDETTIACLEQFVTADRPARYEPIKYGDYLRWKYEMTDTSKIEKKRRERAEEEGEGEGSRSESLP